MHMHIYSTHSGQTCICMSAYLYVEERKSKINYSVVFLLARLQTCVRKVCVCTLHNVMCVFIYTWEHVSRTAVDLVAFTLWHFPSSGCSPDIFLVSDQSWFSQMSHSLRYTSLNEGSANAFAKTQPSMKKLIFLTKQSHHLRGTVILMFPYIVQIRVQNAIFMMTLEEIM